jgi:hypothetical protein
VTGLTFNGRRVFSDKDQDECGRYALMVGLDNGSHYDTTEDEERCLEERWQAAMEDAHDEWWDATQYPDSLLLSDPEAVKFKWLPQAA